MTLLTYTFPAEKENNIKHECLFKWDKLLPPNPTPIPSDGKKAKSLLGRGLYKKLNTDVYCSQFRHSAGGLASVVLTRGSPCGSPLLPWHLSAYARNGRGKGLTCFLTVGRLDSSSRRGASSPADPGCTCNSIQREFSVLPLCRAHPRTSSLRVFVAGTQISSSHCCQGSYLMTSAHRLACVCRSGHSSRQTGAVGKLASSPSHLHSLNQLQYVLSIIFKKHSTNKKHTPVGFGTDGTNKKEASKQ